MWISENEKVIASFCITVNSCHKYAGVEIKMSFLMFLTKSKDLYFSASASMNFFVPVMYCELIKAGALFNKIN